MPSKTKKATEVAQAPEDDISMTDAPQAIAEDLLPSLEEQRIRIVCYPMTSFLEHSCGTSANVFFKVTWLIRDCGFVRVLKWGPYSGERLAIYHHEEVSVPFKVLSTVPDQLGDECSCAKNSILKSPDVEFCGYSIPHPSEPKMNVRIQTYGSCLVPTPALHSSALN
jgi:hypothetical protein